MKKLSCLLLAVLMTVGCFAALTSCGAKKTAIGVQSGTTGECYLKGDADWGFTGYANIDTKSYDNGGLAVADLLNGNVKYVVIDKSVADSLVASNPGTKVIDIALTKEDYGIGVDKNQPDLLTSINNILASKKAEIAAIYEKYADVNDDNSANWTGTKVPAGTYDATKNQLVVATNAAFAPYEFPVGDQFAGIDMEIAALLAKELNMELVISDMDFAAVVSSIGKNGVDIALSGLTINPARAKVVNFSNPYEEGAYQVIIAKSDDKTFDACKTTDDVLKILSALK